MLAANWIRQAADEKQLKCKLGFFLHIPFPPWDIFRLFPWADEILQGMLGKEGNVLLSIFRFLYYRYIDIIFVYYLYYYDIIYDFDFYVAKNFCIAYLYRF